MHEKRRVHRRLATTWKSLQGLREALELRSSGENYVLLPKEDTLALFEEIQESITQLGMSLDVPLGTLPIPATRCAIFDGERITVYLPATATNSLERRLRGGNMGPAALSVLRSFIKEASKIATSGDSHGSDTTYSVKYTNTLNGEMASVEFSTPEST